MQNVELKQQPSNLTKSTTRTKAYIEAKSASPQLPGPLVWAMDPDNTEEAATARMKRLLSLWSETFGGDVALASVVEPLQFHGALEIVPFTTTELVAYASERLKQIAKRAGLSDKTSTVLQQKEGHSIRRRAQTLIDFAVRRKASLIAVNTRSRGGLERMGLGSFAEALIGATSLPVLSLNPRAEVPSKIGTMLLATDFSPSSQKVFNQTLRLARATGAKLVLAHKFQEPTTLGLFAGPDGMIDAQIYETVRTSAEEDVRRCAELWTRSAKGSNVECEPVISYEIGAVSDVLARLAKERHCDLVVVSTRRGPIGQRFLGSVARDLVVNASSPVLVLRG